jgi:hypothetical protein
VRVLRKFLLQKRKGLTLGSFNGEGGVSQHPVLSLIHAMCVWKKSTGRNSRSFRIKSTSSWSPRTESFGHATGLAQFEGKSGAHTPSTQAFQKHTIYVLEHVTLPRSQPVNAEAPQEAVTQH